MKIALLPLLGMVLALTVPTIANATLVHGAQWVDARPTACSTTITYANGRLQVAQLGRPLISTPCVHQTWEYDLQFACISRSYGIECTAHDPFYRTENELTIQTSDGAWVWSEYECTPTCGASHVLASGTALRSV